MIINAALQGLGDVAFWRCEASIFPSEAASGANGSRDRAESASIC